MEKFTKCISAIAALILTLLSVVLVADYLKIRGYKLPRFMQRRQKAEKCCCNDNCDHTEFLSSESVENTEADTYF